MRIAFLLNDLQLSGGITVVVEHALQLSERHGHDVTLCLVRPQEGLNWPYSGIERLHVANASDLAGERFDIALATWWETVFSLPHIDARHVGYFVQSLEDRFYQEALSERRRGAALTYAFPLHFVTEASWIARTLHAIHPAGRVLYVRNGVSKERFPIPATLDIRTASPLRVLVEGRPSVWFKGVEDALRAADLMREPRELTLVTGEEPDASTAFGIDCTHAAMPQERLADLYAETDVLLKLSRVEGLSGPPLEAFHRGATAVLSPVTGHEDYVAHGWNSLIAPFDDLHGTAAHLDALARDRRELNRLRHNAVETARHWPSWEQSGNLLAAGLASLCRGAPNGTMVRAVIREAHMAMLVGSGAPPQQVLDGPTYAIAARLQRIYHTRALRPLRPILRELGRRFVGS